MADLTDLQAAGTTKVVGSDATGLETNPLAVDSNGNLKVGITSDGTNVADVKAPSALAVPADRAVVVAIASPGSITEATVSVGTSNVQIVAANTARRGLIICNCGSNRTVYLRFGATAATSTLFSFHLAPSTSYEAEFPVCTTAIQAIASGTGATLLVQEFV